MTVHKPFVITIVGAESSGKTTLAMRLAWYLGCPWVPEYARAYLEGLGRPYTEEDLGIIASRQLEEINRQLAKSNWQKAKGKKQKVIGKEQSATVKKESKGSGPTIDLENVINHIKSSIVNRHSSIVIVDGGMMNMRMWAKIKYGKTIPVVEEALKNDVTDLYLLCRPLKEWTPDPLREAPSIIDRVWIYNQYLEELIRSEKRVEIIGGDENKNLDVN
ncbi:MAG TPA: ATP-binding protein [Saprospiraceae bacterium]|nr:ATP-binding protein [Saprospiraceae bacterium]